jgi:hypothetical protein
VDPVVVEGGDGAVVGEEVVVEAAPPAPACAALTPGAPAFAEVAGLVVVAFVSAFAAAPPAPGAFASWA